MQGCSYQTDMTGSLIKDLTMLNNCFYHKFVFKHPKIGQNEIEILKGTDLTEFVKSVEPVNLVSASLMYYRVAPWHCLQVWSATLKLGFVGCVRDLLIQGYPVHLGELAQEQDSGDGWAGYPAVPDYSAGYPVSGKKNPDYPARHAR